jgi:DNA modification methylase
MVQILTGDCLDVLRTLPAGSHQTCVTSPPYFGLRDYGHDGQIGLEDTPDAFVARLVEVFREVRRVLRDDGTLWLNLGDSYASPIKGSGGVGRSTLGEASGGNAISAEGIARSQQRQAMAPRRVGMGGAKPKDLQMIPAQVALALRADGWFLRADIIWHKPNPMPSSVRDRPTSSHEHVFLLSKSRRYFYDAEALKEPCAVPNWADGTRVFGGKNKHGANVRDGERTSGRLAASDERKDLRNPTGLRNVRDVWSLSPQPFKGAHFATMPPSLVERCVKAGSGVGDTVLDPFAGAGTTGLVAARLGREATLVELNPDYADLARARIAADPAVLKRTAA